MELNKIIQGKYIGQTATVCFVVEKGNIHGAMVKRDTKEERKLCFILFEHLEEIKDKTDKENEEYDKAMQEIECVQWEWHLEKCENCRNNKHWIQKPKEEERSRGFYKGKRVEEMSKEELINALENMSNLYQKTLLERLEN